MGRRRLPRLLLNVATSVSLAAFLAVATLWMRCGDGDAIIWVGLDSQRLRASQVQIVSRRGEIRLHVWALFRTDPVDVQWLTDHGGLGLSHYRRPAEWSGRRRAGFAYYHWAEPDGGTFWESAAPIWAITAALGVPPCAFLLRRRNDCAATGRCPACGYDLRATPDRCPECGAVPTPPPA